MNRLQIGLEWAAVTGRLWIDAEQAPGSRWFKLAVTSQSHRPMISPASGKAGTCLFCASNAAMPQNLTQDRLIETCSARCQAPQMFSRRP